MKVSFTIDVRLPGMNDIIGLARYNRFADAHHKKKWTKLCAQYALTARVPALNQPVNVTVDWIENDYRRDRDNIMGGLKFILDGIVQAGVLPNDTAKWVREITCRFPPPEKGKARVVVILDTIGGENETDQVEQTTEVPAGKGAGTQGTTVAV